MVPRPQARVRKRRLEVRVTFLRLFLVLASAFVSVRASCRSGQ